MADGTVKILTELDTKGFEVGLKNLQNVSKAGFGLIDNSIKMIGGTLAATGTALTGFGVSAIKVGANFEAQMSKVQAISGATAEELALLEEKAKEMGKTTQFSATESAKALEYMALAGWKTEDMLSGISGIMDLAAASGEDLAMVSDIVTDSLTAFNMKASESGRLADVLAATSSNANTNVAMLGEAFKYAAPVAGALGYSVEDISLALGVMANSGIKASTAGTTLRTLLTNLSSPSKAVATAMNELGISLTDSSGQMLPFSDVLSQLRNGFDGLSDSQKAQYAEMIAGKEGMSGFLSIVNAAPDDFNKLSEAINNSNGKASEMATIMRDNLKGQFEPLKKSLEGLSLIFYEQLETPLKNIVKYTNDMVTSLSEAFSNGGFEGFATEFGNIFAQVLTDLTAKAPEFLNIGFLVVSSFLDGILQNLPLLIESGSKAIDTIVKDLVNNLPKILDTSIKILLTLAEGIISNLPTIIPAVVDIVMSIVETLIDNLDMILDVALELIVALATGIIDSIPILIEKLPIIIMKITEFFATPANTIKLLDAGLQILIAIANGILQSIFKILETIPVIIAKFVDGLIDGVGDIFNAGKELVNGLIDGIKSMFSKVGETVTNLGKNILNKIKGFFKIKSPSRLMRDEVGKMIPQGIVLGINNEKGKVDSAINNILGDSYNIVLGNAKKVGDVGQLFVESFSKNINANKDMLFKNIDKTFDDFFNYTKNNFTKKSEKMIESFKNDINNKISNNLLDAEKGKLMIKEFTDNINNEVGKKATLLQESGKEFIDSFKNSIEVGIENANTLIKEKIGNLSTEFEKAINDIVSKQESLAKNLANDKLFSFDEEGQVVIQNLDETISKLTEYDTVISKLKEKGISDAILDEISSFNIDEVLKIGDKLLEMANNDFEKFNKAFADKQNKAISVAKNFYKEQITSLENDFSKKYLEVVQNLPKDFEKIGFYTITKFSQGINTQIPFLVEQLTRFKESVVSGLNDNYSKKGGISSQNSNNANANGGTDNSGFNFFNIQEFIMITLPQIFSEISPAFFNFGVRIVEDILNGFSSKKNEFFNELELFKKSIEIVFSEMEKKIDDSLQSMGMKLQRGLEDLQKIVSSYVSSILQEMQKVLDIHSPSRKTMWMADMIHEGFVGQFKKNKNDLVKSAKENFNFLKYIETNLPTFKAMTINSMNNLVPSSSVVSNNSTVNNNTTNNGGDFVINIERVENTGNGSIESFLNEAEFYRKQQNLAFGG